MSSTSLRVVSSAGHRRACSAPPLFAVGLTIALAAIASACGGDGSGDGLGPADAVGGDEQDLTEAPYVEVVDTRGAQGKAIVAHGLPAVSRTTNPAGSLVQAALLVERRSTVPGYVGYERDERVTMGSFTGSTTPLLTVDTRTSPPTVTVQQRYIDLVNERLKKDRWTRLVEHPATNDTVTTPFGWTVRYDGAAPGYPRIRVHRDGEEVLTKGAGYFGDYAFGPADCSYTPELASAAISTRHKALVMRVRYRAPGDACAIADRYFTEELP